MEPAKACEPPTSCNSRTTNPIADVFIVKWIERVMSQAIAYSTSGHTTPTLQTRPSHAALNQELKFMFSLPDWKPSGLFIHPEHTSGTEEKRCVFWVIQSKALATNPRSPSHAVKSSPRLRSKLLFGIGEVLRRWARSWLRQTHGLRPGSCGSLQCGQAGHDHLVKHLNSDEAMHTSEQAGPPSLPVSGVSRDKHG